MQRTVTSTVRLQVSQPADLVVSVAASGHYESAAETVTAQLDGVDISITEASDAHRTRLHRVHSDIGELVVNYQATINGEAVPDDATETDRLVYVRPSRYAESDALAPTAYAEFCGISDPDELLAAVSSWVGTRLAYVSGSSLPTDGAIQTLLDRRGVCRDYAHLSVGLLRSLGVPARLVSVYAPGLSPMDFHAVAEAWFDGEWHVVDATHLAPRQSLVRIATGRDAADTAFLNVLNGHADLLEVSVSAVVDTLPRDDLNQLVSIR